MPVADISYDIQPVVVFKISFRATIFKCGDEKYRNESTENRVWPNSYALRNEIIVNSLVHRLLPSPPLRSHINLVSDFLQNSNTRFFSNIYHYQQPRLRLHWIIQQELRWMRCKTFEREIRCELATIPEHAATYAPAHTIDFVIVAQPTMEIRNIFIFFIYFVTFYSIHCETNDKFTHLHAENREWLFWDLCDGRSWFWIFDENSVVVVGMCKRCVWVWRREIPNKMEKCVWCVPSNDFKL